MESAWLPMVVAAVQTETTSEGVVRCGCFVILYFWSFVICVLFLWK